MQDALNFFSNELEKYEICLPEMLIEMLSS